MFYDRRPERFLRARKYDRLAGGPGRRPNLAGVQGYVQKSKTEYTGGEESKRGKQARLFSRCVWGLSSLSQNDWIQPAELERDLVLLGRGGKKIFG